MDAQEGQLHFKQESELLRPGWRLKPLSFAVALYRLAPQKNQVSSLFEINFFNVQWWYLDVLKHWRQWIRCVVAHAEVSRTVRGLLTPWVNRSQRRLFFGLRCPHAKILLGATCGWVGVLVHHEKYFVILRKKICVSLFGHQPEKLKTVTGSTFFNPFSHQNTQLSHFWKNGLHELFEPNKKCVTDILAHKWWLSIIFLLFWKKNPEKSWKWSKKVTFL